MQEMLERIERGPNALPKSSPEVMGVEHRPQVQEGVELLAREIRHVIQAERKSQTGKAAAIFEGAGVQNQALELEQKRVSLQGVLEQKSKIVVRTGRHLPPPRAAQRDDRKGLVVAEAPLLFFGPLAHQAGVNGRPGRGDQATITQLRASNHRVVLRDEPLECGPWPSPANFLADRYLFSLHRFAPRGRSVSAGSSRAHDPSPPDPRPELLPPESR